MCVCHAASYGGTRPIRSCGARGSSKLRCSWKREAAAQVGMPEDPYQLLPMLAGIIITMMATTKKTR
jgi:hypothetical protein